MPPKTNVFGDALATSKSIKSIDNRELFVVQLRLEFFYLVERAVKVNGIKRDMAVVQAAIDDMYFEMLHEWDVACRASSSTGENMVLESMDKEDYEAFKGRLMQRAIWKVARRLEPQIENKE